VLAWATLESTGSLWLAFIVARLIGFIVGALNSKMPHRMGKGSGSMPELPLRFLVPLNHLAE
jgi:hypothetical protein